MFTGMIQEIGSVIVRQTFSDNECLAIESTWLRWDDRSLSENITQNRAYLTVVHFDTRLLRADVRRKILDLLTLGRGVIGVWRKLEWVMSSSSRFGGYLLSGHGGYVGQVFVFHANARVQRLSSSAPSILQPILALKRFACVNQVSLMLNTSGQQGCDRALIANPLKPISFAHLKEGDWHHLEVDLFVRDTARLIQSQAA